jgi:transposase
LRDLHQTVREALLVRYELNDRGSPAVTHDLCRLPLKKQALAQTLDTRFQTSSGRGLSQSSRRASRRRGGPLEMDDKKAMNAIFYVARTGCQWRALPHSLGKSTVHDRFQEWRRGESSRERGRRACSTTTRRECANRAGGGGSEQARHQARGKDAREHPDRETEADS